MACSGNTVNYTKNLSLQTVRGSTVVPMVVIPDLLAPVLRPIGNLWTVESEMKLRSAPETKELEMPTCHICFLK